MESSYFFTSWLKKKGKKRKGKKEKFLLQMQETLEVVPNIS